MSVMGLVAEKKGPDERTRSMTYSFPLNEVYRATAKRVRGQYRMSSQTLIYTMLIYRSRGSAQSLTYLFTNGFIGYTSKWSNVSVRNC